MTFCKHADLTNFVHPSMHTAVCIEGSHSYYTHSLGKINSAFMKALGLGDEKKYTPQLGVTL